MLHTDNIEAATAEIESAGGRVTLQMGDDLLVVKVPTDKSKNFASASAHIASSASPETLSFVQAYYKAREKKAKLQPCTDSTLDREDSSNCASTRIPFS